MRFDLKTSRLGVAVCPFFFALCPSAARVPLSNEPLSASPALQKDSFNPEQEMNSRWYPLFLFRRNRAGFGVFANSGVAR
jgi:hypothetical protein